MHIEAGTKYTDPGAVAFDAADGGLNYTVVGSVNADVIGVYSVQYVAIDRAGLQAFVC